MALADFNHILVVERLLFDALVIDVGAVGAVEVLNAGLAACHLHNGMLAADRQVVDDDVVVRPAAKRGAVFGQLDFLEDGTVQRDDHFRHGRLLSVFNRDGKKAWVAGGSSIRPGNAPTRCSVGMGMNQQN